MSDLDDAIDTIIGMHPDAEYDSFQGPDGRWITEIKTDDWSVTGEGISEDMAKGDLVKKAKDEGRA